MAYSSPLLRLARRAGEVSMDPYRRVFPLAGQRRPPNPPDGHGVVAVSQEMDRFGNFLVVVVGE
jgi:hypothetical protein